MSDLDQRLTDAHDRDDRPALVGLYTEAANAANDETAKGFFLTHAFVYALDVGAPEADELRARLKDMGRI